ncbi:MAG: L,D-transpeptidase family protein [Candidatus Omnitrophica bacterium]|nr:L,D-transpeptidase family protein [Candidatus Omnitrophota bacterium]
MKKIFSAVFVLSFCLFGARLVYAVEFLEALNAHSTLYEVRPGDNLTVIAKKHGVTVGLLQRTNGLQGDRLVSGQKLKVPTYRFSLVVDKSQNTLILKGDEDILKTYVVATGINNSTPVGVFEITDKLENPTWYKTGAAQPLSPGSPENLLGTRWMGISKPTYGIHGTTDPQTLGQQVTSGCVRMRNEEVEELYDLIPPGTEVTIVD